MTAEQVVKVCKRLKLSPDQVLSMYYTGLNKQYPLFLETKAYYDLYNRGLAKSNKPTHKYLDTVDDILNDIPRNAKTISIDPKYQTIIISLYNALDIENTVNEDTEKRVRKYFNDDDRIVELYFIWLYLFPTTAEEKNKGWEYLFGIKYDGVPLRKVIEGNLRNFNRIAYKKDVGAYIVATYLYIRSYIQNGKCYIPKITNFIIEQDEFYANMKEELDKMDESQLVALFELNEQETTTMVPGMSQG